MQIQECLDPLTLPLDTLPGSGTAEQGVQSVLRHKMTIHLKGRRSWMGAQTVIRQPTQHAAGMW